MAYDDFKRFVSATPIVIQPMGARPISFGVNRRRTRYVSQPRQRPTDALRSAAISRWVVVRGHVFSFGEEEGFLYLYLCGDVE